MVKQARIWVSLMVVLAPATLAGCGGEGDREDDRAERALDGTFVGKVAGTKAFVAVVAAPPARGGDRREVNVYVSDGRRVSASLTGSTQRDDFTATSADRDAEATGTLTRRAATGTITLASGKTARYRAARATGAAGLYDLTVSAKGRLSGASATGIGITGETARRTGRIKLADGSRSRFDVTGGSAREVRLIILRGGELRGAGDSGFFIRSSS
jgi:hypothetical protein